MDNTTEPQTLSPSQIKSFGIQGLLGNVAVERNCALADLNSAKFRLQKVKQTKDEQYFELLGRLVKYEPDKVFDEVLQYAFDQGIFFHTQSHLLGVMSEIGDYTTATTKKTYKAHFTIYGNFLKKLATDDEQPISYTGRFLMNNYKDYFVVDKTKSEYKKMEDFIKIKEPVVEPEPEPEPEKIFCENCDQPIKPGCLGGIELSEKGIDLKYCNECYNIPQTFTVGGNKTYPKVESEIVIADPKPKRKYVRKPK
jgi:hypothetical protein